MVTARETPEVAVEVGSHVKQLVEHRFEFLAVGQLKKTRQAEGENVEEFMIAVDQRIDPPPASLFLSHPRTVLETKRGQLGPQASTSTSTCPRDTHGHPLHANM